MLAVNHNLDVVVKFGITVHCPGDVLLRLIQFGMVQNVVSRDIINADGGIGVVINMHRVFGGHDNFVARIIMRLNRGMHFDPAVDFALVVAECGTVHFDVVTQVAVIERYDFAVERLAVNLEANRIF